MKRQFAPRRAAPASAAVPMALAVALAAAGPVAAPAAADPVTLEGITFSDELGGFEIVEGRGRGSPEDPFVVVERITGDGPIVLVVRGLSAGFGNPSRSNHFAGFVLIKVAVNATAAPWPAFRIELQEHLGTDSGYYDGLSFAQDPRGGRRFASDRFPRIAATDEPLDGLDFRGEAVAPGERVTMRFTVSDNTPRDVFYIVQRRDGPVADRPAGRDPAREAGASPPRRRLAHTEPP